MQSFGDLFANNKLLAGVALLIALVGVVGVGIALLRLMFGRRLHMAGGRARQPRLGVVDAFDLDRQRQLVLVRRDNVEHLLMIGGPNDVVVETAIIRANAAPLVVSTRDKENGVVAPSVPVLPPAQQPAVAASVHTPVPVTESSPPGANIDQPKPSGALPAERPDVALAPLLAASGQGLPRPDNRETVAPSAEAPRPVSASNLPPRPASAPPPPQRPITTLPPRPPLGAAAARPASTPQPNPQPAPPPVATTPAPQPRPPVSRATPLPVARTLPGAPASGPGTRVEPSVAMPQSPSVSDTPRPSAGPEHVNGSGERPPSARPMEQPRRPDASPPLPDQRGAAPAAATPPNREPSSTFPRGPAPAQGAATKPPPLGSARTLDALESLEEEMAKLLGRPVTPSDRS